VRIKKGEVVGPAGGETGVPHCLAEVHKPLKAALFRYFKKQFGKNKLFNKACQRKNKNFLEEFTL
jgi:hypothetical protein